MDRIVEVLGDKTALIERALALVVEKIETAIARKGICRLALSGGSTPKPLYEKLAEQALPWENVQIFWGDERYVAPDHPDSNLGMTRQAWLDRITIPAENVHPAPTASGSPQADAERYEAELRRVFGVEAGEIPSFELILLGVGDDGHTASLFPHTPALDVCDRLVAVGQKGGQPRLTFTIPLLNQAQCAIFLAAGANKQAALAQIFAPEADAHAYPARFIAPQGELWWLLDGDAGANFR